MIIAEGFRIPRWLRPALAQLARVVCPPDVAGKESAVIEKMERQVQAFPTGLRTALLAGIASLELGALGLHGRRFSRLDEARARSWFERWWQGAGIFKQLARATKSLVALGYWDLPSVREAMGFTPDAYIAEVARRRLETYGAEIAAHEAAVLAPDPLIAPKRLVRKRHA